MGLETDLVGTLGALLLVLGWLPQTWKTLREHRTGVHAGFSALYFLGSATLVYYSLLIGSLVFAALNTLAALLALVSLYYGVRKPRRRS
jgi:uncharacterized protein with PQ loop repeat